MYLIVILAFGLSSCATLFLGDDNEARREIAAEWTTEAIGLLNSGNAEAGITRLKEAVEIAPDYGRARNILGLYFLYQGKVDDAVIQLQWAVSKDSEVPEYHYHLALAFIAQGSVGFATPALNRALEIEPDFYPAKRVLLDAYVVLGRWDRVNELLTVVEAKEGKDSPWLVYQRGLLSYAEEDIDQALNLFLAALKSMPDSPAPPTAIGVAYEAKGFFDQAEKFYKIALKRSPDSPYLKLILADLYYKTGQYREADQQIKTVLDKNDVENLIGREHLAQTIFQLADIKYQLGEYDDSTNLQRQSVNLIPRFKKLEINVDSAAHVALGIVLLEREQVDTAIEEFTRALKQNKEFVLAWVRLAEALMYKADQSTLEERTKLLENALKAAQKAQDTAPRFAMGHYLVGKALLELADLREGVFRNGTLREALFAFQKARHAKNPPADILVYQANLLSELASYSEAANVFGEAERKLPPKFDLTFAKASELIKAQRYKAARVALSECYYLQPDVIDLGPAMSVVLFELGDHEGAIESLRWAPDKGPLPGLIAKQDLNKFEF